MVERSLELQGFQGFQNSEGGAIVDFGHLGRGCYAGLRTSCNWNKLNLW